MKKNLLVTVVCTVVTSVFISGCAPLVFGGAALIGGSTIATTMDRRTLSSVVNDEVLQKRIKWEVDTELDENINRNLDITVYNGRVLLTGEIESEQSKKVVQTVAASSLDVSEVINEIQVGENSDFWQKAGDSRLATSVRAKILSTENLELNQMKVVVNRGIVYLMGILTADENKQACQIAATTSGVRRVVSVVEIMTREQINERTKFVNTDQKIEIDNNH